MKHRTPTEKDWVKCRRSDGILLRNPAITAECSKEVPAPELDANAQLSKIQIHVHDMHKDSVDSDDTL